MVVSNNARMVETMMDDIFGVFICALQQKPLYSNALMRI